METQLVDKVLRHPQVDFIVKEIQQALEEERKKREHFYNVVTETQKAEFISGEIIIHSPVRIKHNEASLLLASLLSAYVRKHKLGFVGIEKILISLSRNDYEPDICFFNKEKAKHFTKRQSRFPAPDFIVEVLSDDYEERDRIIKFQDYQSHKVEEYWIIDTENKIVEQYHLVYDKYKLITKSGRGQIKSFAIKNFEIPIKAIFDEELNLKVLSELIN